jgi:heavy metal-(Cd/Co/Hg/Pb/Zn)-translocating P-type ATPase
MNGMAYFKTLFDFPVVNTIREKIRQKAPFLELAAALLSGILIFFGWVLEKTSSPAAPAFYLAAFLIGGFAKAKEGITDTIEKKKLNVEILMIVAAIGASIIGYWAEGALLIFIFAVSGALETYTMGKSRKEISALMQLQPEKATLVCDGEERIIPVKELEPGDVVLVKPGERIPIDGIIKKGLSSIDESAITGEPMPVQKAEKDMVYAGTINVNGTLYIETTKVHSETLFQKIIDMVQNAEKAKSPSQLFIERFEGIYVNIVLIASALMLFLPHYLFGWTWNESFYRAMVLLVVASPCAVVASITPAALSAISSAAKKGILFKGGLHVETLGNVKAIAFDKTGTLTNGKPEVTDFLPIDGESPEVILASVASIESQSTHPLARALEMYARKMGIEPQTPDRVKDVSGQGIIGWMEGKMWRIGNREFVSQANPFVESGIAQNLAKEGKTLVFIEREGQVVALIALKDRVREQAKEAIHSLKQMGIRTYMITGDNFETAKRISEECRLDGFYAECLPGEKVEQMKRIHDAHQTTAMVGDGINDAPALAAASVGIAMGEGTDVALETADIVLMKNDLAKIADALRLSKKMNRIVKQNLFFSIAVIILLVMSNFFQAIELPFGVIGHEGSTIAVILNGLRLLRTE